MMCGILSLALNRPGMIVHSCNPSVREMGAGRPEIQGHPRLHSESETNLDYMRPVKKEREEDEVGRRGEEDLFIIIDRLWLCGILHGS